jgi:hypothetical protein
MREIHAAHFSDRVVHHLLVPQLEILWEPWFIDQVYSNRVGKGTHKAVAQLQAYMRKADATYFCQLDIKNFFYSIRQDILLDLLAKGLTKAAKQHKISTVQQGFLYDLCQVVITSDYRNAYELQPALAQQLPAHKRLALQPSGVGLPIGNLTSQFFANVYLNALDQFIKHQLKCRYYVRFVDDFILLADKPSILEDWCVQIVDFLSTTLALTLKAQTPIKTVQSGSDFLGYIVRPYYKLVRKRVVQHLKAKLSLLWQQWFSTLKKGWLPLSVDFYQQVRATLASYIGHCKHAHSLRLIQAIFNRYAWLNWLFRFDSLTYRLVSVCEADKNANFYQQRLFFMRYWQHVSIHLQFGQQQKTYPVQQRQPDTPVFAIKVAQAGFNHTGIRHRRITAFKINPVYLPILQGKQPCSH